MERSVPFLTSPIKIYCSSFDTDPTGVDANDPLYFFMGHEIGLSPEDALELHKTCKRTASAVVRATATGSSNS